MTDQPSINIDGKEYPINSLSEEALNQLAGLDLVDRKILKLQQEIAILQTARKSYAQALAAVLPKN